MLSQIHKRNKESFQEKYKCIQKDGDGNGYIPYPVAGPNGEEGWEGDQCQFHAEYLFPMEKDNTQSSLALIDGMVEMVEKRKLIEAIFPGSRYTMDYKVGYNEGLEKLKSLLLAQREIIEKSQ